MWFGAKYGAFSGLICEKKSHGRITMEVLK